MNDPKSQSDLPCSNARLKRKLILKENKIKCGERSQSVSLYKDQRIKRNCTPLSDITMMNFLNQDIPTNNDLLGYYNGQAHLEKTNARTSRCFHQTSHRQNLLQRFEVTTEMSLGFHSSSTEQSSCQSVGNNSTIFESEDVTNENIFSGLSC